MDASNKINSLLEYLDLNAKSFSESLGYQRPQVIYDIIKGKTKRISPELANKITSVYPKINKAWLLADEGEMLKGGDEQLPEISFTKGAPYYDVDFLLGFDEIEGPSTEYPEYRIVMPGYEKATLWCNASGHSMEPEINNGDIIALQRVEDFSFLPFGDVYGFITTNGLRTIKRLGRSDQPGHYRLIPTNKDYDEQDIPINKIAIVYRVMGAMKPF